MNLKKLTIGLGFIGLLSGCNAESTSVKSANDSVELPNGFALHSPLKIGDRVVEYRITPQQVQQLMNERITLSISDPRAYEFLSTDRGRIRVETCGEYLDAIEGGASAQTTFDITMESFFKLSCNTLKYIQSATPPQQSYLREQVLTDLDALPVNMLSSISPDDADKLSEDTQKGMSLKDYVTNAEITVLSQQPYELKVEDNSILVTWTELLRADFNGNGLEDVLVFATQHSLQGSYRSYSHLLIEKTQEKQELYQVVRLE